MMSNAAKEATVIVPVIQYADGFKVIKTTQMEERSKEINKIWSQILHQKSWMERIPLVLLTKARRHAEGNNEKLQHAQRKISAFAWDHTKHEKRVVCCDSLLAMAALHLEHEIELETPSSTISMRIRDKTDVLHPVSSTLVIQPDPHIYTT
jgi:hypothetical protein